SNQTGAVAPGEHLNWCWRLHTERPAIPQGWGRGNFTPGQRLPPRQAELISKAPSAAGLVWPLPIAAWRNRAMTEQAVPLQADPEKIATTPMVNPRKLQPLRKLLPFMLRYPVRL